MLEIFVNLSCINQTPVNTEFKIWSEGGSVYTGYTVLLSSMVVVILTYKYVYGSCISIARSSSSALIYLASKSIGLAEKEQKM